MMIFMKNYQIVSNLNLIIVIWLDIFKILMYYKSYNDCNVSDLTRRYDVWEGIMLLHEIEREQIVQKNSKP